ncbi:hypothetical protein [Nocardioides aurantiacus]|uniref:Uncharacterized protein n=1 Tax=Nocardioides aurantiacus TaxID=86796 RepID=A0A3N2CW21_9ACTN|nr:hypothetical protein [Nocardioides aurantiacus]ROR91747.1 hypothetical protein EDD33_2622 [Nocardioides aurantiacus]
MSQQGDLLNGLRTHDLPPKWDGRAVSWTAWEYARSGVFICPPPRNEVCEGCRKPTTEKGFPLWSICKGLRADSPHLTLDDFAAEEAARARLPWLVRGKMPRHWWIELYASRCHLCDLDTVTDMTSGEVWTLDHTDYGDEGSSQPEGVRGGEGA